VSYLSTENDFQNWIRSKWTKGPFYIKGHRFEKTLDGSIKIDRGQFDLEEAQDIARMLLSPNPILKLSAQVGIWERNGGLTKAVLVAAIILLILVIIFIRR